MYIRILFLVVTVVATLANGIPNENVKPYDIEEEVRAQLEDLKISVRSKIFLAFGSISDIVREVYYARNDAISAAEIAIRQEFETINAQMTTLKDLAQAAGQNVDVCLAVNEPILNQLPEDIIDSLMECLAFANYEVTIIQNDSRYRIDTLMNEVHIFEFQLDLCAGDFLCMSPLIQEIELAFVTIPQKIDLIVQEAEELAGDLKILIQQCTDDKVAQFNTESGIVLAEVTECVNNILA